MSHRISISTFALMFSMSLFSATVFAVTGANQDAFVLHTKDVRIRGTWPALVTLNNNQPKIVQVIRVNLSKSATKALSERIKRILKNSVQKKTPSKQYHALNGLPSKQYNGMNGTPVLDQGQWGTCATFAITAAIDAVLSLTDDVTVSQLCNLELGVTLQSPYASDGGWNGSYASVVLDQISTYGYLDMDYQTQNGCGGLTAYPTNSANNGSGMPLADFEANSNPTFRKRQNWWSLIPENTAPIDGGVLKNVKNTLVNGDDFLSLVVFSVLLDPNINNVGVAGTYHANLDTWVLLPQISQYIYGGNTMLKHEMIINGYDDNACASYQDAAGASQQQCGLLHLRNSWGSTAGDNGDYYMSYDYFNGMVTEAYAVVTGGV